MLNMCMYTDTKWHVKHRKGLDMATADCRGGSYRDKMDI